MMQSSGCRVFVAGAVLLLSTSARAQEARPDADTLAPPPISGWLFGASLGLPGVGTETVSELVTVGLQWTGAEPGALALDFSIGTAPRLIADGIVALAVRGGGALPIAVGRRILLLPSGGWSFIAGAADGGAAAAGGFNAGIATVILKRSRGLRAGVTWHWLSEGEEPVWLLELGFVALHRQ